MMTKKLLTVFFAAAFFATGMTSVVQAAVEVTGGAYVGMYDKYLWRGFNLSGSKPVAQGGVDLTFKGFTLSYWSNLQLRDADHVGLEAGEMTETDVTLDYSFDLNDLLSVSIGNIFYALDGADDTNELFAGVAGNTLFSPSLTVYWDYDEAKGDGIFLVGGIGHTFGITEKLGVNLSALASYNYGSDYALGADDDHHGWHNYELGVSADYAVTESVTLSPSFLFSSGLSGVAKGNLDTETLVGMNLAFSF